ncbi:uncharacterized protein AMSG_05104 [Thecamonas trahens ATCC 50062]|uniref:Uncharacterized protein n=1 Tax=Thecamonas trahens ATCC 50062 TaxID=461836 RepID=A0A0L0D9V0_THETB|nr:hypothetical protein AMSG_05104 [Thecamonas trahens ATCC 50062]KNC49132.1 hypothetical protein AMSG_05104 [Thecamonas trahens ATCC 50062]|eukprot:XP_013758159.1 hypothetical protein AMSG_05104 [Thecamonas trahens ATCC 50062]
MVVATRVVDEAVAEVLVVEVTEVLSMAVAAAGYGGGGYGGAQGGGGGGYGGGYASGGGGYGGGHGGGGHGGGGHGGPNRAGRAHALDSINSSGGGYGGGAPRSHGSPSYPPRLNQPPSSHSDQRTHYPPRMASEQYERARASPAAPSPARGSGGGGGGGQGGGYGGGGGGGGGRQSGGYSGGPGPGYGGGYASAAPAAQPVHTLPASVSSSSASKPVPRLRDADWDVLGIKPERAEHKRPPPLAPHLNRRYEKRRQAKPTFELTQADPTTSFFVPEGERLDHAPLTNINKEDKARRAKLRQSKIQSLQASRKQYISSVFGADTHADAREEARLRGIARQRARYMESLSRKPRYEKGWG